MTLPTDIDRAAPVVAHHGVDIAAPLGAIWELHTGVAAWPAWNVEVTAARLDGPFARGSDFTWTSYGFTVTSTLYDVVEHARTLWGGEAQGITGIHEWRFEQTSDGVHVTTSESFAGEPVEADPGGMQSILDSSLPAWLARLKHAAETGSA